jgi:putative transposon-encoded protein
MAKFFGQGGKVFWPGVVKEFGQGGKVFWPGFCFFEDTVMAR